MDTTPNDGKNKPTKLSRSDSTAVANLFFDTANDAEDVHLGYIQKSDFCDSYAEWALDAEVDTFMKERPEVCQEVIERLDKWFREHRCLTLDTMYRTFGKSDVEYSLFKKLLINIEVPASDFERHLICVLFDFAGKKCINIFNFENSLNDHYRARLEAEDKKKVQADLTDSDIYIKLTVLCIPFTDYLQFHGHIKILARVHMFIGDLVNKIQIHLPMIQRDFKFFKFISVTKEARETIPMHFTFKEAGYSGGPLHNPKQAIIFYSYFPPGQPCPLLMYTSLESEKRQNLMHNEEKKMFKKRV